MSDYSTFLASKRQLAPDAGFPCEPGELPDTLKDFQRALTAWALRKGRAALFASTGLGKTRMQVVWAERVAAHTGGRVLILAPLAVARQTADEATRIGIEAEVCRDQSEVGDARIVVTNYDRLHLFEPSAFAGVVLDESSILKNFTGKVKQALTDAFRDTPYRLCATATPAPNDVIELCNHAEFLGVMRQKEILSTFFINKEDGAGQNRWRLKRYARAAFFEWLASWSMSLVKPSDLGFDDDGYDLPPLNIHPVEVESNYVPEGQMIFTKLKGVQQRAEVRANTIDARVKAAVDLIRAEPDEQWLVWVGLNSEDEAMAEALAGDGCVTVRGKDSADFKAESLLDFARGDIRILVSKPSIAGFGMNFQRCARMVFVGIGDSFETYFQALRRCWRFGQTRPVEARIVYSDVEGAIYENVLRKEREHEAMMRELLAAVKGYETRAINRTREPEGYRAQKSMELPSWLQA